ncbi:hypothetical protein OYC64_001031 [Pagothenia borchgrevinki]|uniref:Uncharacterized protein n=1 Tax=Pagothenia borchgrevinki TaxID=8213 RepID=A0ABD2HFV5_PAGBO
MNVNSAPRILSVLVLMGSLDGSSAVKTITSPFSCCPDATLPYKPECDTTFKLSDKNFAWSSDGESKCIAPCTEMKDGRMKMTGCHNVTACIVCRDENNKLDERKIQYIGDLCAAVRSKEHGA